MKACIQVLNMFYLLVTNPFPEAASTSTTSRLWIPTFTNVALRPEKEIHSGFLGGVGWGGEVMVLAKSGPAGNFHFLDLR